MKKENPQIKWDKRTIYLRKRAALKATIKKEAQLPAHQLWDHEINLKEGAQLKTEPIYKMSEIKLQAAKEFIDKNL